MQETVTVTRLTATGTVDRYKNQSFTETSEDIQCAVSLKNMATDYQADQNNVNEGLTLYFPTGTVIDEKDVITVRGLEYVLDGESFDWKSPFSAWTPGVVINVKRRGQTRGS